MKLKLAGDTPAEPVVYFAAIQADLPKIPTGNFEQNRKLCTTLPCLPLLFANNAPYVLHGNFLLI